MKKYESLDHYYASQSAQFQELLYLIRETVLATDPSIREMLKYEAAPFFVKQKVVCYLGIIHPQTGVEVGFPQGRSLPDPHGLLQARGRKIVRGVTFLDVDDFVAKAEAFQEILEEALLLEG